jgi:hypothetical protein
MLKNIFLLRGNLPRWAIPVIWTIYLLDSLWTQFSLLFSTFQNFSRPDYPRWMIIRDSFPNFILLLPYFVAGFAHLAMIGIVLMAAQKILFDKNKLF